MTSEAIAALEEFRAAVDAGDQQAAVETGSQAAQTLVDTSDRESGIGGAARLVHSRQADEDARAAAEAVIEAFRQLRHRRTKFGMLLQALSDGQFDSDEMVSITDSVIDAYQAADEAVDQFESTAAAQQLHPILVATAPTEVAVAKGYASPAPQPDGSSDDDGKGGGNASGGHADKDTGSTTETVEIGVENVVGKAATGITTEFESELSSASLDTSKLSGLQSGASTTVPLSFDSDTDGGRYEIVVTFGSEEGGTDSVAFDIVIIDKAGYIEKARTQLWTLKQTFSDLDEETNRPLRPMIQTVSRIRSGLADLKQQVEDGTVSEAEVNRKLFQLRQQTDSLTNQTESLKGPSEARRASLEANIEKSVELLRTAREADS